MRETGLMRDSLERFREHLIQEERAVNTIEKYDRDIRYFLQQMEPGEALTKELVLEYKRRLAETYKTSSANSMLVALNRFLEFIERKDCQIKLFKVQRVSYRKTEKELTREEYRRLVVAAKGKQSERLSMLIQAICSTGIRVSEHRFITAEERRSYLYSQ